MHSSKIVQDVDTKRTIGSGKHFNGLYYLTITQKPCLANHITCISDLWHHGLGHPSTPLHCLVLSKNCSIKTIEPFDMSYCDI